MNQPAFNILSTLDNYLLSPDVLGFAGAITNRDNLNANLLHILHNEFEILVFHRPAPKNSHKPQDAVGVAVISDKIIFGISDGVSIVNGRQDNESGLLSLGLIQNIKDISPIGNMTKIPKVIKNNKLGNLIGASTLQRGEIEIKTMKLSMILIGEESDLGINAIFDNNNFYNIRSSSSGFLPHNYKAMVKNVEIKPASYICITSDGIRLLPEELKSLLKIMQSKLSISAKLSLIESTIKKTHDDQSMILIKI